MVESLVRGIARGIHQFEMRELDVAGFRERLESARDALDHTFPDLLRELENVVPDLEQIQFTMHEDEQRPAAIRRIATVKVAVTAVLDRVRVVDLAEWCHE